MKKKAFLYYIFVKNFKKVNLIEKTKAEFGTYQRAQITDKQALDIQNRVFAYLNILQSWQEANNLKVITIKKKAEKI